MGKKCLMKNNILKIIIPVCIAIIAISIISLNSIGTSPEENNFSTDHFVSKTITVGEFPIGISVNPMNNIIYVTNNHSDTISVIDGKTNSVIETIIVGDGPAGISINPNT